ncbi:MAG: hypothetical protein ACTSW4_06505 [Candidatus Ranarchaeia archaeon]
MVSKIELWLCDICKSRYENKKEAKACEALGKPDILYKKGDTVQDKSGMGSTLLIQDVTVVRGELAGEPKHLVQYLCMTPGSSFTFNMRQEDLKPA